MGSRLLLGLEFDGEYDPRVRAELEQLVAALQVWQGQVSTNDAQFLVAAASDDLTAERVGVSSSTILVDYGTRNQARWHANPAAFAAGYSMGAISDGGDGGGEMGPPGVAGAAGAAGATGATGPAGALAPFMVLDGEDGLDSMIPGPTGATGPAGSGSGTVTHTAGALTLNKLVLGAGTDDAKVVTAADGQIPLGKTSDGTVTLGTITAGTGVTVTNGAASITIAANGDGFWTTVAAASDQDISSNTTVATDAELFFTMVAGAIYEVELHLAYSSPAGSTTPDLKFGFNGPATITGQYAILLYVGNADSFTGTLAQATLTTTSAIGTATTPRFCFCRVWASSSGGGSGSSGFQFQWAQNASSVNATRRLAGSSLRYRRIN